MYKNQSLYSLTYLIQPTLKNFFLKKLNKVWKIEFSNRGILE